MSVIFYNDQKFHRIYQSLSSMGQDLAWLFHYPDGWNELDGMDEHFKNFVNDLRRANIQTWNRQYPDDPQPLNIIDFSTHTRPYKNRCEFYKSLRGLRYNLYDNDGQKSDICDCFRKLDRLIDHVASEIIDKLPEFQEAATW